jgi:hypothetical protein
VEAFKNKSGIKYALMLLILMQMASTMLGVNQNLGKNSLKHSVFEKLQ